MSLLKKVMKDVKGIDIETPFRRFKYVDAMNMYGSDKPDLRNPLIIIDLSEFFETVDFAPFRGKIVRAIRVPGAAKQSKSWFRDMEKFALSIGMKGLGYISVKEDMTYKGPIDKFMNDEQKVEIAKLAGLQPDDVLYFISDEKDVVAKYAGQIRTEVAKRMDLSLWEAIQALFTATEEECPVSESTLEDLKAFTDIIENAKSMLGGKGLSKKVRQLVDDIKYFDYLIGENPKSEKCGMLCIN